MFLEEINIKDLINNKQIYENKYLSHLVDPLYMKYQELYNETDYINKSVILKNDNKIIIPITEDKNKSILFMVILSKLFLIMIYPK